jgi:histidinol-phosphate aminotransferase
MTATTAVQPTLTQTHLDYNELPTPIPDAVSRSAARATLRSNRYPSVDSAELRREIANVHGVDPSWVVTAAGSVSLIAQILHLVRVGQFVLPWPSFDAYPMLATQRGHSVVHTALENEGAADLDAALASVTDQTSLIAICNPNSPTGAVVKDASLRTFLRQLPDHILVLIDEAYAEFIDDSTAARGIRIAAEDPRVVVTRTFSKAYGLAGLRVGYAVAQPPLVQRIATMGVPYAVSAPAEAAAIEALRNPARMRQTVAEISMERARLAQALRERGHRTHEGQANFIWVPSGAATEGIARHLAEAGIMVKAYPGLGLRITVGSKGDTDQLLTHWPDDTASLR